MSTELSDGQSLASRLAAAPDGRQPRSSSSSSPAFHSCTPTFPLLNRLAMTDSKVPQPGPAKLKRNAGPDEWLEAAKDCKYLSEAHMKQLCEMVKEYMMEGKPRGEHASAVGYQVSHNPLA